MVICLNPMFCRSNKHQSQCVFVYVGPGLKWVALYCICAAGAQSQLTLLTLTVIIFCYVTVARGQTTRQKNFFFLLCLFLLLANLCHWRYLLGNKKIQWMCFEKKHWILYWSYSRIRWNFIDSCGNIVKLHQIIIRQIS